MACNICFLLGRNSGQINTESQYHRMVWVGRLLKDYLVPTYCHLGQGHLGKPPDQAAWPWALPVMGHPRSSISLSSCLPQRHFDTLWGEQTWGFCEDKMMLDMETLNDIMQIPKPLSWYDFVFVNSVPVSATQPRCITEPLCLSWFVLLTCSMGGSSLQCKHISDVFDVALALVIYWEEIFLALWRKMLLLWIFTGHKSNHMIGS